VQEVIGREQWDDFVKEVNRRNELRPTRLEVLGQDIGAQEEEQLLPLTGISLEERVKDAPRVEITLGGETAKEERHLTHTISRVKSIMRKIGTDLREDAIMIEDENGTKTILLFETLPELAPAD
jgi:hypothetical protein